MWKLLQSLLTKSGFSVKLSLIQLIQKYVSTEDALACWLFEDSYSGCKEWSESRSLFSSMIHSSFTSDHVALKLAPSKQISAFSQISWKSGTVASPATSYTYSLYLWSWNSPLTSLCMFYLSCTQTTRPDWLLFCFRINHLFFPWNDRQWGWSKAIGAPLQRSGSGKNN